MKRIIPAVLVGAAMLVPAMAEAGHEPSGVGSFTGCLNTGGGLVNLSAGQLYNVAQGDAPAKPCATGHPRVHLSGGDITEVGAGTGLTGGGTSGSVALSVDTAAIQRRVAGTCATGSFVKAVNQDGTVGCGGDGDTTYAAGSGLDLAGTTFSVERGYRLPQTCTVGQVAKKVTGGWECAEDTDTDTTYSAGTGLGLAGTTFSLGEGYRLPQGCAAGKVAKATAAGWVCADDVDTDTNTTYSAGTGLGLTGTTFSADFASVQRRVAGTCPAGQAIQSIDAVGTVTCQATGGPLGYQRVIYTGVVPEGQRTHNSLGCPAGKVVVGGGVLSSNRGAFSVLQSGPESDTRWAVEFLNRTDQDQDYASYAVCVNP